MAFPGVDVPLYGLVTPNKYNVLITNHGAIMIFWVAMPVLIAAFGNFLIPLMIGCDDMVFPRINRLSYQIFLLSRGDPAGLVLRAGRRLRGRLDDLPAALGEGASTASRHSGPSLFLVAVALEFVAFLLGGINFITTAMNSRAPGMKMYDIPIVVWMIVIASILFMASVGPLIAGAIMLFMDQQVGTAFFDPDQGGDPILWQHLFWFFGHPEVYVVLLPALGIVAEIITVFSRKKLFAYKTVLYTVFGTGVLSFMVWAHHQFIAGIDPRMANIFTITTLLISVPIAEMMFVYIATLYGGSITLTTPMLWALSFIAEFLIGGVTGIFLGASGADIYLHDTYFVLAHFHYTFVPIAIIGTFAGVTYWFPKMFGRMMNETLGQDPLLDHDHRVQLHLHPALHHGRRGRPPAHLQLQELPRARRCPGSRTCGCSRRYSLVVMLLAQVDLPLQLLLEPVPRAEGGQEPVAGQHARVDDGVAAAPRQLAGGPAAERSTAAPTSTATRTGRRTTGRRTCRPELEGT